MKTTLLIPIYQPDDKVLPFLKTFDKDEFDAFLVVDDGSGDRYKSIFDNIRENTCFNVISYPVNHGKGHALKTGMKKLLEENPDLDFIMTADGDGQHLKKDILNIEGQLYSHSSELILGSRDFSLPDVPEKSRKGNHVSSVMFKLLTGRKVKDTQTGLRAIPKNLFTTALETEGARYEYENNFLINASKEAEITEINIETVYENNNEGSHYRPFRDSMRIAKKPLLYALASVLSWVIDLGLFSIMVYVIFRNTSELNTAISTVSARIISGIFNFFMLRYVVFKGRQNTLASAFKYLILFLINMALSTAITAAFTYSGKNLTVLKLIIDSVIAVANYFINRLFVFTSKSRTKKRKAEASC